MICRKTALIPRSGRSSASPWATVRTGSGRNQMFDDPKQLYASTRTFPVSLDQVTVFEAEMGAETYRSNGEDLQDAFAGLILMDFSTGMIFDFITTGKKIGAIYERLLIPGVTDEKTAFTYLIESPFSVVRTAPS